MRGDQRWRVVSGATEDLLIELGPDGEPRLDARGHPAVVVPYPKGLYDPLACDQLLRHVPSFGGDLDAMRAAIAAELESRRPQREAEPVAAAAQLAAGLVAYFYDCGRMPGRFFSWRHVRLAAATADAGSRAWLCELRAEPGDCPARFRADAIAAVLALQPSHRSFLDLSPGAGEGEGPLALFGTDHGGLSRIERADFRLAGDAV